MVSIRTIDNELIHGEVNGGTVIIGVNQISVDELMKFFEANGFKLTKKHYIPEDEEI